MVLLQWRTINVGSFFGREAHPYTSGQHHAADGQATKLQNQSPPANQCHRCRGQIRCCAHCRLQSPPLPTKPKHAMPCDVSPAPTDVDCPAPRNSLVPLENVAPGRKDCAVAAALKGLVNVMSGDFEVLHNDASTTFATQAAILPKSRSWKTLNHAAHAW